MTTTISSKGQIVLPAALREQDRILAGERFDVERVASGQYLLKKVPTPREASVLEWLEACPEQDWFAPLPSGLTDEL